jgi:nucleotide-binding universal stress UspA family protein
MRAVRSTHSIVVGFDGSVAAESAVDWAAAQAKQRGVGLRVVAAVSWPYNGIDKGAAIPIDTHQLAHDLAADGRQRARKLLDESDITAVGRPDDAANALVDESESAELVVVGHPSRSRLGQVFMGSVVYPVIAHAACDVAVVPDGNVGLPGPRHPVMVGIDGSQTALKAVDRAAEEAHRWGASLEIVQTWSLAMVTAWSGPLAGTTVLDKNANFFGKQARESVATAAAQARALHQDQADDTHVQEEQPARALVDLSGTAGLLVVGSRGLGRFDRLLLGSVSRYVIAHATVPVLVVRR